MICYDPYKNLNIVTTGGQLAIGPCCISTTSTVNTINFYQDDFLNQVRKDWNDSKWPSACNGCKTVEDQGLTSRRQGSNNWYNDHNLSNKTVELLRLDYWTGDLCNLACVICGPYNSSRWKQELNLPRKELKSNVNKFWQQLPLDNLKFVHFNGGEPLLSKEHESFLRDIPNKQDVYVNYNTNATIIPSDSLLELWSQFKLIQLDFSIDDIKERFEYQRWPAKWAEVTENLQWFLNNAPHNCMFAVNTTVSILNQSYLDELEHWLADNFYQTRFTDPIEHRKQWAFGLFNCENAHKSLDEIVDFLNKCDLRRGTDWKNTFPNLLNSTDY